MKQPFQGHTACQRGTWDIKPASSSCRSHAVSRSPAGTPGNREGARSVRNQPNQTPKLFQVLHAETAQTPAQQQQKHRKRPDPEDGLTRRAKRLQVVPPPLPHLHFPPYYMWSGLICKSPPPSMGGALRGSWGLSLHFPGQGGPLWSHCPPMPEVQLWADGRGLVRAPASGVIGRKLRASGSSQLSRHRLSL